MRLLTKQGFALVFERSLGSSQTCDGHAEGAAAHVIVADHMAEFN